MHSGTLRKSDGRFMKIYELPEIMIKVSE